MSAAHSAEMTNLIYPIVLIAALGVAASAAAQGTPIAEYKKGKISLKQGDKTLEWKLSEGDLQSMKTGSTETMILQLTFTADGKMNPQKRIQFSMVALNGPGEYKKH